MFNSFESDNGAWAVYYTEGGKLPEDTYGMLIRALRQAKENPEIRNFVIDLSTNGGGQSDVAMAVITMVASKLAYMNITNALSGEINRECFL